MTPGSIQHAKEVITFLYYLIAAIAFLFAAIRVLYGWFRAYDNSIQFTNDMATSHLPYLYESLQAIATGLGSPLPAPPPISFSRTIPGLTPPSIMRSIFGPDSHSHT